MSEDSGNSETTSPPFDLERAQQHLDRAEQLYRLATQAQAQATALREMAERELAAAKALMPLPLWEAAKGRH
jgi:hypothetical protein